MANDKNWKGLKLIIDGDVDKLLDQIDSNNLVFAPSDESVDVEEWKDKEPALYSFVTYPVPTLGELLVYASNIATIAGFIILYFNRTKRRKIILKNNGNHIEIDGDFSEAEIVKAMEGFITISTKDEINTTKLKIINKLRNNILFLKSRIIEYEMLRDLIKENYPDRVCRYNERIQQWEKQIEEYEKTIDDLTS